MTIEITRKEIPIKGISATLDDVRKLVERLVPHVDAEGDREVAPLLLDADVHSHRHEELLAYRERAFQVTVTVAGRDGESLFGHGTEPFSSPNIPDPINSIFVTNNTAYQSVTGRNPLNSFVLQFDFRLRHLLTTTIRSQTQRPILVVLLSKATRKLG